MYIIPTNGPTVTIFAPNDCDNHCPFCVSKSQYDKFESDPETVIKSINRLDKISPKCDLVISGGEPLKNLDWLENILQTIKTLNKNGSEHKLYIDTTLPVSKQDIFRLNKWRKVITGINVARYIGNYIKESNDILISLLTIPVRITCVLYDEEEGLYAKEIIDRFKDYKNVVGFQFRDDYTNVHYEDLYNCNWNGRLNKLLEGLNVSIDSCEFDFTSTDWTCTISSSPNITFYRTMINSKIVYTNVVDPNGKALSDHIEINNIIIAPNGDIYDDWIGCGQLLNLRKYRKDVMSK